MKSFPAQRHWLMPIVFSVIFLNIPLNSKAEVLDLQEQLWEMKPPALPSLEKKVNAYLPEESIVFASRLVLHLSQRKVNVYQGETLIATFPVAVGKEGWETPEGNFNVIQKIKNPAWEHPWNGTIVPPGPKNPLGQRWIGFWTDGKNYIGFHGTPNESLIGQAVSHGCVRMKNKDIEKLFELVSLDTSVTVQQ